MKKHEVDIKELQQWQSEQKVCFARSSKEKKVLYCTLRGNYEVWCNKEMVLETMQASIAVDKYNSINMGEDKIKTDNPRCKYCGGRTAFISGVFYYTQDSEPYLSGKNEKASHVQGECNISGFICDDCDNIQGVIEE